MCNVIKTNIGEGEIVRLRSFVFFLELFQKLSCTVISTNLSVCTNVSKSCLAQFLARKGLTVLRNAFRSLTLYQNKTFVIKDEILYYEQFLRLPQYCIQLFESGKGITVGKGKPIM